MCRRSWSGERTSWVNMSFKNVSSWILQQADILCNRMKRIHLRSLEPEHHQLDATQWQQQRFEHQRESTTQYVTPVNIAREPFNLCLVLVHVTVLINVFSMPFRHAGFLRFPALLITSHQVSNAKFSNFLCNISSLASCRYLITINSWTSFQIRIRAIKAGACTNHLRTRKCILTNLRNKQNFSILSTNFKCVVQVLSYIHQTFH